MRNPVATSSAPLHRIPEPPLAAPLPRQAVVGLCLVLAWAVGGALAEESHGQLQAEHAASAQALRRDQERYQQDLGELDAEPTRALEGQLREQRRQQWQLQQRQLQRRGVQRQQRPAMPAPALPLHDAGQAQTFSREQRAQDLQFDIERRSWPYPGPLQQR